MKFEPLDGRNDGYGIALTGFWYTAVMLSLARSRYRLMAQFAFTAVNAVGVFVGIVYNANTPDLYPNNAHHKIGWIITWVVGAQITISILASVAGVLGGKGGANRENRGASAERQGFIPVSTEAMAQHESQYPKNYRFSQDSGQGTEPESSRSHSLSDPSGADSPQLPLHDLAHKEYNEVDLDDDVENHHPAVSRARSTVAKVAGMISDRLWKILIFAYNFNDRTILPFGFVALCTGIIAYGRFFVSCR